MHVTVIKMFGVITSLIVAILISVIVIPNQLAKFFHGFFYMSCISFAYSHQHCLKLYKHFEIHFVVYSAQKL